MYVLLPRFASTLLLDIIVARWKGGGGGRRTICHNVQNLTARDSGREVSMLRSHTKR